MKNPHLFWILIDSARNYPTDQDMRGLPQAVVDFGKEGLYFKNVITSAPSTIQSISSMMTSSPSYLLSRSYNNFRGKFSAFDYFPEMLRANGYETIGAIYFKHGREVMSDMFGLLKKKFYPKGLSHSKEVWSNDDIYQLFKCVLEKQDWSKPTMTYLHFNVRVDDNVSDIVNQVIEDLKDKDLYNKSVILMNSDHGYPDADKGYDFEQGLKEGWGHDKYMTNDNILTPLVIRHPKIPSREIEQAVSTVDIAPTLCYLMGIESSAKFHGINIIEPKVNLAERLIRTDNRYVGQSPSFHAYTKGKAKLIVYRESDKDDNNSFYNLGLDPKERNPIEDKNQFEEFFKEVQEDESQLNLFHEKILTDGWIKNLKSEIKSNPSNIVVILDSTLAFEEIALKALCNVFPKNNIIIYSKLEKLNIKFDLKIYILESEIPWELKGIISKGKLIKAKKEVFVDNNGDRFASPVAIDLYKKFITKRIGIIKYDPLFVFDLLSRVLKKKLLKPIR
jgi:hypothetical protein